MLQVLEVLFIHDFVFSKRLIKQITISDSAMQFKDKDFVVFFVTYKSIFSSAQGWKASKVDGVCLHRRFMLHVSYIDEEVRWRRHQLKILPSARINVVT